MCAAGEGFESTETGQRDVIHRYHGQMDLWLYFSKVQIGMRIGGLAEL